MKQQVGSIPISLLVILSAPAFGQSFSGEEILVEPGSFVSGAVPMDVDGDGRMDVLTFGSGPGAIAWLRSDPDVGFVQQAPLLSAGPVRCLTTGDVDLDGDLDIVLGGSNAAALSWMENQGGGSFGAPQTILSGPFSVSNVEGGDFDGDGDTDYAMQLSVPGSGSRLSWVENVSVSGLGIAFGSRQLLSIAQGRYTDVAVADVDGDGDDDVIGADETAPQITFHENIAGGALGTGSVLTGAFSRPYQVSVADVDGDGVLDVLATERSSGTMEWVRGLGGGSFGPRRVGFNNGGDTLGFLAVDLDGDGASECLHTGSFSAPDLPDQYYLHPNTAGVFGPRQLLGTTAGGGGPRAFAIVDADQDGDPDVVAVSAFRNGLHLNNGGSLGAVDRLSIDTAGARDIKAADLDGDGDADLAVALSLTDDGLFAWVENQRGRFGGAARRFSMSTAGQVDAVDLDQDGDLDLVSAGGSYDAVVAAVRWAENLGQGSFSDSRPIYFNLADGGAVTAYGDMEGDGDLDVFLSHQEPFGQNFIHAWAVNSPGGFTPGPNVSPALVGRLIKLADMDGDGDADAIYINPATRAIFWRRNTGAGSLGQETQVSATGAFFDDYGVDDLDGDGDVDALGVGPSGSVLFLNTGVGVFAPGVAIDPQAGRSVLLRDVDGDGLPDVLLSGTGLPARWMRNLGAGSFGPAVELQGVGSFVLDVADFDGDLDFDVLKRTQQGAIVINRNSDRFGVGFCGPAEVHSGGLSGAITASGSPSVAANDVQLRVEYLPASTFGFFLVSTGQGYVANPGGSQGNLCLGGAIGRHLNVPGAVFTTSADGAAQVNLDLTRVPTPFGAMALVPGDTRYAQAWFRDSNPAATSNFTGGLALEFE